ncbi:Clavaminate synthase-like protein [Gonapodya prolifera JEL478]|uniref:Clavaminate synthase-like protein n=1 Tax=Gonapodya prolifera (strain JEL478) TaxID=1344416 RepID=A0A139AHK2_GONPJ|nr:Clavaminate synthase-like protein [Gonapodya prolifera JEL478]|eukprot:KXS16302.1 Clavaminate synthase-like protein [Gonapodya prolifera JEL478]
MTVDVDFNAEVAENWAPLVTVDLRYVEGDFEQKRFDIAKDLKEACFGAGFFILVNHGIDDPSLMYSIVPKVLSLSKDEKLSFKSTASVDGDYTGYVGDGSGNNVEYYNVGKFIPQFQKPHPEVIKQHYDEIKAFSHECHRVALQVKRLLAIALEIPASASHSSRRVPGSPFAEHYIEDLHRLEDVSGDHLRFMRYPAVSAEVDAQRNNIRVPAHTDYGSLTMMFNPRVVALQVLTSTHWRFVKPTPGALICNIGDTLQFITGNVLKSTQHRVMRPPGDLGGLERHNLIYFSRATDTVRLGAVPSPFVDETAGEVGLTAGEWVAKRVQATTKRIDTRTDEDRRKAEAEYDQLQRVINEKQGYAATSQL